MTLRRPAALRDGTRTFARAAVAGALLAALLPAGGAMARTEKTGANVTLTVGPGGEYRAIGAAVAAADRDRSPTRTYTVVVQPGTYRNDFAEVTRPMTIEAAPGGAGRVVLLDSVALPNEKGIILTTATLTVVGLTFEGAHIADSLGGNGAGIRDQSQGPATLTVDDSTFIGNQEGILQGEDFAERIVIAASRFEDNGNPNPQVFQHAIYINHALSLTVDGSLFCGQLIGHDIKSRARSTLVEDSQIYDGAADPGAGCRAGTTSYGVDAPNGGVLELVGDRIVQGPHTENVAMVAVGEEGLIYPDNRVTVRGCTFVNTAPHAIGIFDPHHLAVALTQDTFKGVSTTVSATG